jgi:hypothetical protein
MRRIDDVCVLLLDLAKIDSGLLGAKNFWTPRNHRLLPDIFNSGRVSLGLGAGTSAGLQARQNWTPATLAGACRRITMTRGPPGNFWDRFHYRSIPTKIGEALRIRLVPMEPASDQILNALQELDHQQEDHEKGKAVGAFRDEGRQISLGGAGVGWFDCALARSRRVSLDKAVLQSSGAAGPWHPLSEAADS